jgi:8-oxo-dGTP diphosphatase
MRAVHRVVAGLLVRGEAVLLCHRSADRTWFPDVWDLPGGHIENGETPVQALARELAEELGIAVEVPGPEELAQVDGDAFTMGVWLVRAWSGHPTNVSPEEHDAVAWFERADLDGLALAHPSYGGILEGALRGRSGGR